ncbi:hypothetical protein PIB30_034733 [Stylosanthes scabra]|uniref:Uncharacterized protein n=1 Tax=Stylosanthes scabra TaxID=79078 RepID=A0ABU6WD21_9FABA|nr:hypothetical protein [Stylosanthes scabra]
MDMKSRCHSCKKTIIQFGMCCNEANTNKHANSSMPLSAIGSSKLRWKVLWMKLKKKKKLFDYSSSSASSSSQHIQVPYDPYTYSQNFDHGNAKDEPDNLSRSFSARYAQPSKVTNAIVNHKT